MARLGRESSRVVAVGVALVLVGAALAALSLHRITTLEDDRDHLALAAIPASQALEAVRSAHLADLTAFDAALHAPEPVGQALLFDESRRVLSDTEGAWREYARIALELDGERELQDRYDEVQTRLDTLTGIVGLAVLDEQPLTEVLAAPAFTDLVQARAERDEIIDELRRLYRVEVAARTGRLDRDLERARLEVLVLLAVTALCGTAAFAMTLRSTRRHERITSAADAERAERARRDGLEARLHRAFDMARSESAAFEVVRRGIAQIAPSSPAELLLADSHEANVQRVLEAGPDGHGPGCPVVTAGSCPAAVSAETRRFPDSDALDACPHLQDRPGGRCSAVCVPVRLAGTGVAVLHMTDAPVTLPPAATIAEVELLATQAGERIGLLRLLAETTQQARHDPLTGLLNRRSLASAVARLEAEGSPFVVAYGDLDRFKELNDAHGHDTGDRALRLFSRVLRDNVRPMDLVARYGGEEFVVVLPRCGATEAADVIERVRRGLARELEGSSVPAFTVSFGVATAHAGQPFDEVVGRADRALLAAKAAGRDRVLLDDDGAVTDPVR